MNIFSFVGNLGNPAEQRFTNDGKSVVGFSVAVKSGYGDKAVTTWVKCSLWGKQGEGVLPYLNKGQQVAVSGELSLREYQNKDGSKGSSLEVRVNTVTLCGKSEKHEPEVKRDRSSSPQASNGFEDMADDIPFVSSSVSHDLQSRTARRMNRYN